MRGFAWNTVLAALLAGGSLLAAGAAHAGDRWDKRDRWDRHHHHDRGWHKGWHKGGGPRRVIVEREPVIIERTRVAPVYVAPPMMPSYGYGPPMDPSVNFNFSFPMR
ncbi:hypothetical protein [Reyranella sp.]|uniref:hypothetical protein n=1 Tax=Reyranella sp. TaxID=1929291 RepID=UPI003BAA0206